MSTPCERFINALKGTWEGQGKVFFPKQQTIDTELTFTRNPGSFVHTEVFTYPTGTKKKERENRINNDGGWMQCTDGTHIESFVTHNTGNSEVLYGDVSEDGTKVLLNMVSAPSNQEMVAAQRHLQVEGDRVHEKFYMQPRSEKELKLHFEAEYFRVKRR